MKKLTAIVLCLLLAASLFSACGREDTPPETAAAAPSTEATKPKIPSVRLLSFQPELEEAWDALAAAYTADTGVPVTVVTEASDSWRQILDNRLPGEDAPTLFQLCRPTAADDWKALCSDLSDTDAYGQLLAPGLALTDGDAVLALPCNLEASGIWVNKALLAQAGFAPADIVSLESLGAIAQAVTENADNLSFSAFPFPGCQETAMDLAAAAIAWEFQQDELADPADFRGTALEGLRSLLDIMLQNSKEASSAPARDAFLEGEALFLPGRASELEELSAVFSSEELLLIPAYLAIREEPEEEAPEETTPTEETAPEEDIRQELLIGSGYYWCVNPNAPEQDLSATLDFLNWCLGTEEGAAALADLGYCLPYTTAPECTNPFLPEPDAENLLLSRNWAIPSAQWQSALSNALAEYTADPTDSRWDRVAEVFADYWAAEYALTGNPEEATQS